MDFRTLATGWLPCGTNGLKGRLEFRPHEQPAGFWIIFLVYGAAGAWLVIFALRLFTGMAEPLPLR
ncbi:hypothetical protein OOT00_05390 [Desulfobotulus sp. H1]|uniref:Uncharacterized protein n=1 Tax=Desulfobotulus pelophilus TaxID=2823377 RepID=A0ABT3N7J5_9BACT|nr:hypothetical protein [Desulfobotulus pelophilus]MCW7753419.1 hypothetical protein [Desulfobotulus pelophilus]